MRADGKLQLATSTGVTDIPVASTGTNYSPVFPLFNAVKIGLFLTATSTGSVDIVVELEVSEDGTNFAEPDGYSDIVNITDEVAHAKTIYDDGIPASKWGRIAFTGQGANHASTTIAGHLNIIRDER